MFTLVFLLSSFSILETHHNFFMQNRDDGEVSQCNSIVHDASYYFQTKVKYGSKLMIFGLFKKKSSGTIHISFSMLQLVRA